MRPRCLLSRAQGALCAFCRGRVRPLMLLRVKRPQQRPSGSLGDRSGSTFSASPSGAGAGASLFAATLQLPGLHSAPVQCSLCSIGSRSPGLLPSRLSRRLAHPSRAALHRGPTSPGTLPHKSTPASGPSSSQYVAGAPHLPVLTGFFGRPARNSSSRRPPY
ncbi:hypothetical protein NDU88_005929 [Pleurodeles waltl]|uniref:Uncharacterized protein n=1 Tax=Pleurodeles waltl TaxID=8319 RepID=A0AAV7NNX0_PLEWA|nr:hypothetical protein NDU88_005929 [Pleurodeles waltl]